jgi:hypothetical protein
MSVLLRVTLTALLGLGFQWVLPWWSVVVAAFLVGTTTQERFRWAFLVGVLGIGLLWLVHAWGIHLQTGGILSDRVAEVFGVGSGTALVFLTGLIGGLIGGLGGMTGAAFREVVAREGRRTTR